MRFMAASKPVVGQLEMILLFSWALPLAKLSAAFSGREHRKTNRP